jgi:murein DD-endopeptidase MepM/ murein hydrolase activator NlpD
MIFAFVVILLGSAGVALVETEMKAAHAQSVPTPVIHFPVVADAALPGYFDHQQTSNDLIKFYDGRANPNANSGFSFSCPAKNSVDWVGCLDTVSGEGGCVNANELWYDDHNGIDFEYFPDWQTGAICDLSKFQNRIYTVPIFSAVNGEVEFEAFDSEFNGRYYRILVDADGDGDTQNDNIKVWYLHLRQGTGYLYAGLKIKVGDYIGDGDMTGKAFTPHLHFHAQRKINSVWQVVDPFGWATSGGDPYPYPSSSLWSYRGYAPGILQTCISNCMVVTN